MDSLMDAMTNVVGVLLLILIVLSLGITEKVAKVLEDLPEVTAEELEAMKVSRKKTLDNLADLKQTQTNTLENLPTDEEAAKLIAELEDFEKDNKDLAEKTSDIEEWRAKVDEEEKKKKENDEKVLAADKENNRLAAILAQTPEAVVKAAKDVKMPNPRLADEESSALYLVCKNQKLYYFGDPYEHALKIRDVIDQNFTDLAYTGKEIGSYTYSLKGTKKHENGYFLPLTEDYRLTRSKEKDLAAWNGIKMSLANSEGKEAPETTVLKRVFGNDDKAELAVSKFRYDMKKIAAYFGDGKLGPRDFKYYVEKGGGDRVKFSVGFREEGGWTQEQFSVQNSEFDQLCKKISSNRRSLFYFYVAPDSFDTYLQARSKSEFHGIQAGWSIWEGEKLSPDAIPRRSTMRYNLNSLPEEDYMKVAQIAVPFLAEELTKEHSEFAARVEASVPKEVTKPEEKQKYIADLSKERALWNARNIQNWVTAPLIASLAAEEATTEKEVQIEIHPPEIPHIRIFAESTPPEKVTPVVDTKIGQKPGGGNQPVGGNKLILD